MCRNLKSILDWPARHCQERRGDGAAAAGAVTGGSQDESLGLRAPPVRIITSIIKPAAWSFAALTEAADAYDGRVRHVT